MYEAHYIPFSGVQSVKLIKVNITCKDVDFRVVSKRPMACCNKMLQANVLSRLICSEVTQESKQKCDDVHSG